MADAANTFTLTGFCRNTRAHLGQEAMPYEVVI